jgi:hypothetical protein
MNKETAVVRTKKSVLILVFLFISCLRGILCAQALAVKNNLIGDGFLSPNLALELKLGSRVTLELNAHYNPFYSKQSTDRNKYWLLQPELRLWRCEPFSGSFWGVHLLAGEYNIGGKSLPLGLYRGTKNARYEGSLFGAGLSYGYQWILSPRWGLEAEVGGGYVQSSYDRYRCLHCGERTGDGRKHYLGPTKAALSVVYLLK